MTRLTAIVQQLTDDELGPDCEPDECEPRYGHCDCCGVYMIDDCERGCGTCYECRAMLAAAPEVSDADA